MSSYSLLVWIPDVCTGWWHVIDMEFLRSYLRLISLANQWWRRKMLACEQALLFGRVKRVSRERASERRSTSFARSREAHFASPNWRACSQATKCGLFSQAGTRAQQNLWGTRLLRSSLMTRGSISLTTFVNMCILPVDWNIKRRTRDSKGSSTASAQ